MSIVSILYTIIILFVVVVIHELGHMIVAKANGIYVKEFWVGFGPSILSFTKNDTKYCLKPIPFGGACVFEDDPECEDPDKMYNNSSVYARILTTFAGPFFNMILAYMFAVLIISLAGNAAIMTSELVEVNKGSVAMEAGLQKGDIIREYNGKKVHLSTDVVLYTTVSDGSPVRITYERDNQLYDTVITPKYSEEYGRYMFGIVFGKSVDEWTSINILKYSFYYIRTNANSTIEGLKALICGRLGIENLNGPVGMADMVSDVYNETKQEGIPTVLLNMLNLALIISASLGIMNLVPLPGFDGGKLILLFVEAIRRKPVSRDKEALVNFIGFALLMLLMVFVMYNDIMKLIRK